MSMATMDWLMALAWEESEREADEYQERRLARSLVLDENECPWPWYADDACIVIEPEVIAP